MSTADQQASSSSCTRKKFPRISHVVNGPLTGSGVGRDDLVLTGAEADEFLGIAPNGSRRGGPKSVAGAAAADKVVTVEEKIDGANLAVYLDEAAEGTLLFQNRGHMVAEGSATQWRGLDRYFLQDVRAELMELFYTAHEHPAIQRLLSTSSTDAPRSSKPSDWVLYGEWVIARHTVCYEALPSPFIAFDLYHDGLDAFLSTALRNELLATYCPSVRIVPILGSFPLGSASSWQVVHDMWYRQPSHFGQRGGDEGAAARGGQVVVCEGAIVRVEDAAHGVLHRRCKAVHNEFVAAIEDTGHWTSKAMVKNGIVKE